MTKVQFADFSQGFLAPIGECIMLLTGLFVKGLLRLIIITMIFAIGTGFLVALSIWAPSALAVILLIFVCLGLGLIR